MTGAREIKNGESPVPQADPAVAESMHLFATVIRSAMHLRGYHGAQCFPHRRFCLSDYAGYSAHVVFP